MAFRQKACQGLSYRTNSLQAHVGVRPRCPHLGNVDKKMGILHKVVGRCK